LQEGFVADDNPTEKSETTGPDLSDFGNLTPVFSNRFYVFAGPELSKIFFGETLKGAEHGETFHHTSITMHRSDLIALMKLIARLTEHRVEAPGEHSSDG